MFKSIAVHLSVAIAVFAAGATAQIHRSNVGEAAFESVVTILLTNETESRPVGSGLIVRSDGYILTPYSLVRGAKDIQVKLRNGETYDKADVVATDERRNVALLHIAALNLRVIPSGASEETQVGSNVTILANSTGRDLTRADTVLIAVQMADAVAGAGKGYRLLQVDQTSGTVPAGGLLLDEAGRSLGMITTTPEVRGQNIAVPLSSVLGLIRSASMATAPVTALTVPAPTPSTTPVPIAQTSVQVPERGVTPLQPRGPGSVVVKPKTVPEILAGSKTIFVRTGTISFKPDQLINALNKQKEFADFNLTFVDEQDVADLILDIDHVLMTWKYTFKLYSQRLGTVIATGDRIILDGNLGADAMAERVVEKLKAARGR